MDYLKEVLHTDACITGCHTPREARGDDLCQPAWLVGIPMGFEAYTATVYGYGLSDSDACEALEDWIRATNPAWADEKTWERCRETMRCEKVPAGRARYLFGQATGDGEGPLSHFLLKVDNDLLELCGILEASIKTTMRMPQCQGDLLTSMIHRSGVDLQMFVENRSDESENSWIAEEHFYALGWVPDDVSVGMIEKHFRPYRHENDGIMVYVRDNKPVVYAVSRPKDFNGFLESKESIEKFLYDRDY